jgi:hypothetical protein
LRLVAKTLGKSQRVLVVSPSFLDHYGRPENPAELPKFATVASIDAIFDRGAPWNLTNLANRAQQIELKPKLVTSDLRVDFNLRYTALASRCCQNKWLPHR